MAETETTQKLLISGKVQGVFFRQSMQDLARDKGLNGWVRNLDNGQVEAVLQGDPEKIGEVIDWSHKGPTAARVEHVATEPVSDPGNYEGFEIR